MISSCKSFFKSKALYSFSKKFINSKINEIISNMSKTKTLSTSNNNKKYNKEKFEALSGHIYLHVIGNGGKGNPKSLFLFTDNKKYLFNCGEGVQRLSNQFKARLSHLNDIFITSSKWDNIGGLCGLSMTLQSIGCSSFTIHGPSEIALIFELTKLFGVTNNFHIEQKTILDSPHSDSNIKVDYVILKKNHHKMNEIEFNLSHKKLKIDESKDDVYAYVCKLIDKPGSLMIKKCIELKVPVGPLLGQLKAGNDITLKDGKVIRWLDVRGPDEPGPKFIILDCPSLDYIDSLINNQNLDPSINSSLATNTQLIVHFGPLEVVKDKRYQAYVTKFSSSTIHLGLNEGNSSMAYIGANEMQFKLRSIDPSFFPLLNNSSDINQKVENFYPLTQTSTKYFLRPMNKQGVCHENDAIFNQNIVKSCLDNINELAKALENYKKNIDNLKLKLPENEEPEIIFLGTGSAIPGKVRNSSCILINVDEKNLIMLDCGEGSFGQFYRYFGERSEEMLTKLKFVFISHLHADHQIGLISFLLARQKLNVKPLTLMAPTSIHDWLKNYSAKFQPLEHLYQCYITTEALNGWDNKELMTKYNLKQVKPIRVAHCRDSCGILIILNTNPEYQIVYSGDAMPSDSLIYQGYNCDLLIHEATMGDDLIEEAKLKRHSTSSQAIEVGRRMKAKYTILTHFSQRYSKLPYLNSTFDKTVGIAYDNMSIKLSQLPKLNYLLEPLRFIFSDHYETLIKKSELKEKTKHLMTIASSKLS